MVSLSLSCLCGLETNEISAYLHRYNDCWRFGHGEPVGLPTFDALELPWHGVPRAQTELARHGSPLQPQEEQSANSGMRDAPLQALVLRR